MDDGDWAVEGVERAEDREDDGVVASEAGLCMCMSEIVHICACYVKWWVYACKKLALVKMELCVSAPDDARMQLAVLC